MQSFFLRFCIFCCFLLAISSITQAQLSAYNQAKEKIYLHTNHVFFKPGSQLYYKIYVVDAKTQTPSSVSPKVNVEVISPSGNLVQKQTYPVMNGYAEGSFDFEEGAVGGVYKLKAYTQWMQNESDSTFFSKEITVQKFLAPRVLLKLEFPQKGYGAGDEVTADFSMRSLADQPLRHKQANFKVSIDGKEVETSVFTTDYAGKATLKFRLPAKLVSNDGLLNITVQHDAYTESISRSIPIVLNKIDVQFMPEGGALVVGLPTQVAFKAIDDHAKPVDIKGYIVDQKGNKVIGFSSYHFGMGRFAFTPQQGFRYKAIITAPAQIATTFPLADANPTGMVLNIRQTSEGWRALVHSSMSTPVELVGEAKGSTVWRKSFTATKGEQSVEIDASVFPVGIAKFTLLMGQTPVAERLAFLNKQQNLQVAITTDKQRYQPREKVQMTLTTTDSKGKPIPANFSLSVVDDKLWSFADDKQDHLLSWLLLGSELKGKVEEPPFYFKPDEPKADTALDLVMMTNGYRYFEYISYVKNQQSLKYLPDQGVTVSGILRNNQGLPTKGVVTLVSAQLGKKALQMTTDATGVFSFSNVPERADCYLLVKTTNQKEGVYAALDGVEDGRRNDIIRPRKFNRLAKGEMMPNAMAANAAPPQAVADEAVKAPKEQLVMNNEMEMGGKNLDEVVVTAGLGMKRQAKEFGAAMVIVKGEEVRNNMNIALNGKVAGLHIQEQGNPGNIAIRGSRSLSNGESPLLIVDGVPTDFSALSSISPNNINSIEVVKEGAATAQWGAKAGNGVISVETKDAKRERINLTIGAKSNCLSYKIRTGSSSYTVARKFYVPVYQSLEAPERNDFRETIYWNSVVQTNKSGTARLTFYNSDATTTFRAIAEGIGYNGLLGRAEATYAVQNAIVVDAKVPPYLTVGDKALLPVNLKNNTEETKTIHLQLAPINNLTIGVFKSNITLAPSESFQVLVPIEAKAALQGVLHFKASGDFSTETLALPIEANEKGFVITNTCSGNATAKYRFAVADMIPGSLKTDLKVYRKVEGQLLDGIENMLSEPHGCFEQTSSTTYPNVFILKYLRSTNKSNPEVERRAMDYIQRGYQRLVGFETSENGFEWFGNAPAHQSLTAYGLLEFTDMQSFVAVDQAMLARTKAYLLKQRDGNGGFKLSAGGYDRFASVPNKISNIYTVYALTQAGVLEEIRPEYNAAFQKALDSKDAYMMAMMAIAAANMHDQAGYQQLMNALATSYREANFASETSVVNSRDLSLKIESIALYVLALAKEPTPRLDVMAALLSQILNAKSEYGYGSTQATVLALNAVVTYAQLAGSPDANATINFSINGGQLQQQEAIPAMVKSGANLFEVSYAQSKQAVPFSFQVSYNSLTPPNSSKAVLKIATSLGVHNSKVGETVRMNISVTNQQNGLQPMAIAKIGIPAGLTVQPWQLKEILDKHEVAYYEIFNNYLVFYWMGFSGKETKTINLDLKAEIPGSYKAKASNAYLYYTPEHKHWNEGTTIEISE